MNAIQMAHVRDDTGPDAYRVLVDRLWPRGVRTEGAPWQEWLKGVAPSASLRKWYGHDPALFETFRVRYLAELHKQSGSADMLHLLDLARHRPLVLVTATRDIDMSQAPILREFLERTIAQEDVNGPSTPAL